MSTRALIAILMLALALVLTGFKLEKHRLEIEALKAKVEHLSK